MNTYKFTVTITTDRCTKEQAKDYVEYAVQCWGGSYHPDSPFFGDNKKVRVTNQYRPKRKKP